MKVGVKHHVITFTHSFIERVSNNFFCDFIFRIIISALMQRTKIIQHNNLKLRIAIPNLLCKWRAETFSNKEPETLEWIDNFPNNSVLWDVGANIGLYSLYAAKKKGCKVWAFEPSVFNLEILARNIFFNNLTDKICIVPVAVSNNQGSNKMRMSTTEWGGALSTFSEKFGYNGLPLNYTFEFQTIGMSLDYMVENVKIPLPDFIKLDVDGLEHFILKGGISVLSKIKGILIEINDEFQEQSEICKLLLTNAGLTLQKKHQSEMMLNPKRGFQNSYNQIWSREC